MDIKEVLKKPLDGTYSVSSQVILFSDNQKQICLVLEKGGWKKKFLFSFKKDKAWGNPGGGVHKGETPVQGAIRELIQETGFPEHVYQINPEPVDYKIEGTDKNLHYKIIFIARITCNIDDFPFVLNPVGDTIARKFISISELPSPKAQKFWKLDGSGIFPSHLDYILANQRLSAL
ncbi:NUDIX hydrolase [Candidatus Parcubacteria bacterium]|jgi:8-oxo-dGTP pyrophosphatase MutT (NUDIX family)|nr:MAG: NUDIX hydrolase [Candidatus Parcubacteria bacterium]